MSTEAARESGNEPSFKQPIRAHRGEWLAALTLLLAILGMAVSSPALVGPDEPAHQATASYTTVHIWPPTSETDDYTPGILKFGACMSGNSAQDASCEPGREDVTPSKVRIMNYPPVYYWVVGLGQKFAPTADTWMDVGGRVASLLLNIAGLVVLALCVRRKYKSWGTYLLLIATPMAVFLWAVVNPNGWEITSGLLFAYFFAQAWWGANSVESPTPAGWRLLLPLGAASILFALSRHDAIVWLALLVVSIVLMGRSPLTRLSQARVLAMGALGLIFGLAWQLTHPAVHDLNNPDHIANPALGDYLHWFSQIDEFLPVRLRQMVGVLGWLDTPTPQILVLLLLISWAAFIGFLFARTRIPALALVAGFLGTFLLPSILEELRWNDWPYWYQGRITLPFILSFLFVFLLRFGGSGRRAAVLLSIISAFVLTFMVWQNLMRYAFGTKDYIPVRWDSPAIGGLWFWSAVVIIFAMTILTIVRTVIFVSEREGNPRSRDLVFSKTE